MKSTQYVIEGEFVSYVLLPDGSMGWRCTCSRNQTANPSSGPDCFHTRVVKDAQLLRIEPEESGPIVVSITERIKRAR